MLELTSALVGSEDQRKGGKVKKRRFESGTEVGQEVKQCGLEDSMNVASSVDVNSVRGWVTREAAL